MNQIFRRNDNERFTISIIIILFGIRAKLNAETLQGERGGKPVASQQEGEPLEPLPISVENTLGKSVQFRGNTRNWIKCDDPYGRTRHRKIKLWWTEGRKARIDISTVTTNRGIYEGEAGRWSIITIAHGNEYLDEGLVSSRRISSYDK